MEDYGWLTSLSSPAKANWAKSLYGRLACSIMLSFVFSAFLIAAELHESEVRAP